MSTQTIKPFERVGGHTVFENDILDYVMPLCKPNTWKVVCAVLRKTIGWEDKKSPTGRKEEDRISFSQFQLLTGISSRETMADAIEDALTMEIITRRAVGNTFMYQLNRDYVLEISTETVPDNSTEIVPIEKVTGTETVPPKNDNRYGNRTAIGTDSVHTKQSKQNLIKQIDEEEEAPPPAGESSNIFSLYEKEIGPLTPVISDALREAEKEYPASWFAFAFGEAARNNKRSWGYVEAILKRWKREGFQSVNKSKPSEVNHGPGRPAAAPPPKKSIADEARERLKNGIR
jgi:DnaD/phage-associated family protein